MEKRVSLEEVESLIRDSFWILGPDSDTSSDTAIILTLKRVAADLAHVRKDMVFKLPRDLFMKLKIKSHTSINAFRDLATADFRIRDICIVDIAIIAVNNAVDMLSKNGQPPTQLPRLAKTRRQQ